MNKHAKLAICCLASCLVVTAVPATAQFFEPIEIRAGAITDVTMTDEAVTMFELETLLLAEKYNPTAYHEPARAEVTPGDNEAFVIVTVLVQPGKSIGKYDYRLQFAEFNRTYPCFAMARDEGTFDPRLWQVVNEDTSAILVRLLYRTDLAKGEVEAQLVPQLDLTLPESTVSLTINSPVAAPEPEPEPQDVTEAEEPPASE